MKKLLALILMLALVFSLAATMVSCGKDKDDDEEKEPSEPSCTAHVDSNGDEKCDKCGASVPKAPADNGGNNGGNNEGNTPSDPSNPSNPQDPSNPSNPQNPADPGKGSLSDLLNKIFDEDFSLLTVPSEFYKLFGEVEFEIYADENTNIILISDVDTDYAEYSYVGIQLAKIAVNTKTEVPTASVQLSMGLAKDVADTSKVTDFDEVASITVNLVGEKVSVELKENEDSFNENYDINELFYTAVADMMGMSYDELVEVLAVVDEVTAYIPAIGEMLGSLDGAELPAIDETFMNNAASFLAAFGTDLISETKNGTDTVYALDLTALNAFVDAVEGKSVEEIVDSVYGAGACAKLEEFILAVPDMTVGDIVEKAISFAESYGIAVADVYALVEGLAYEYVGAEFDIEALIDSYSALSLGEILAGSYGATEEADIKEFISGFKSALAETIDTVLALDIDELFYYVSTGSLPEGEIALENSITGMISHYIETLDSAVTVEFIFDANGVIKGATVSFAGQGIYLTKNSDGTYTATAEIDGMEIVLKAGKNADGYVVDLSSEGYTVFHFDVDFEGAEKSLNLLIDEQVAIEISVDADGASIDIGDGVYVFCEIDIAVTDGVITSASMIGRGKRYDYQYDEYGKYIGETFTVEEEFSLNYTYENGYGQLTVYDDDKDVTATGEIKIADVDGGKSVAIKLFDDKKAEMLVASAILRQGTISDGYLKIAGYDHICEGEYDKNGDYYGECTDVYTVYVEAEFDATVNESGVSFNTVVNDEIVVSYSVSEKEISYLAKAGDAILYDFRAEINDGVITYLYYDYNALNYDGENYTAMDLYLIEYTEKGNSKDVNFVVGDEMVDASVVVTEIEGGIQLDVDATADGVDVVDATLKVTASANKFSVAYDIAKIYVNSYSAIAGKGGLNVVVK